MYPPDRSPSSPLSDPYADMPQATGPQNATEQDLQGLATEIAMQLTALLQLAWGYVVTSEPIEPAERQAWLDAAQEGRFQFRAARGYMTLMGQDVADLAANRMNVKIIECFSDNARLDSLIPRWQVLLLPAGAWRETLTGAVQLFNEMRDNINAAFLGKIDTMMEGQPPEYVVIETEAAPVAQFDPGNDATRGFVVREPEPPTDANADELAPGPESAASAAPSPSPTSGADAATDAEATDA